MNEAQLDNLNQLTILTAEKLPSPQMQLAVNVPVYAEYDNGNIFRFIEAFTKQTASPESIELLFIINNRVEESQARSPAFLENQHAMEAVRYVQGSSSIPENINAYRTRVLKDARSKRLNIHCLDLSTGGIKKIWVLFEI